MQVNFFFAQFFISSVSVIKNYILIADVCNSVQFLVWRDEDESLTLVSKDMDTQTILSTAFITDGPALGIIPILFNLILNNFNLSNRPPPQPTLALTYF